MGTSDEQQLTPKPEITDEHRDKAKEMAKSYDEQRPTTTLPGSGGTVAGTAVNDWVDEKDQGKVDFSGQEEAKEAAERASKEEVRAKRENG